jgi:hypothetical protein
LRRYSLPTGRHVKELRRCSGKPRSGAALN